MNSALLASLQSLATQYNVEISGNVINANAPMDGTGANNEAFDCLPNQTPIVSE